MLLEPQACSALLPSQQQLLLRIQHATTLEPGILLVTGRKGAGKYTIASALLEQFGANSTLAWLTCHGKSTTDSLRQQLLTQLIPQQIQNSNTSLSHYLNSFSAEQPLNWTIVINQAELMGNQLLVELWGLVEHCRQNPELKQHISIILFAEPGWSRQISQEMKSITGVELPLLQVPALSLDERKQLFVLLQSRVDEEFTDVEMSERNLGEQEGLPGEVVAMFSSAGEALHQDEEEEELERSVKNYKWGLIAVIALLPMFTILWWAYDDNAAVEPTKVERRPGPEPTLKRPAMALDALKQQSEKRVHKAAPEELPVPLSEPPSDVKQQTLVAQAEDESEKQHIEVDEATIEKMAQQLTEKAYKTENSVVEELPQSISNDVATVEAESVAEVVTVLKPSVEEKVAPVKIEPELSWWQKIPESHYVLQLALMSSESGLQRFAKQNGLSADKEFRFYPAKRNGKVVYIGVYGDYATKGLTKSAIRKLKEKSSSLAPWPKSAVVVKQEAILLD